MFPPTVQMCMETLKCPCVCMCVAGWCGSVCFMLKNEFAFTRCVSPYVMWDRMNAWMELQFSFQACSNKKQRISSYCVCVCVLSVSFLVSPLLTHKLLVSSHYVVLPCIILDHVVILKSLCVCVCEVSCSHKLCSWLKHEASKILSLLLYNWIDSSSPELNSSVEETVANHRRGWLCCCN